jgi:hypothetical protein
MVLPPPTPVPVIRSELDLTSMAPLQAGQSQYRLNSCVALLPRPPQNGEPADGGK